MSKPKRTPMATGGATYPRLETRPLAELAPNERNPRTITPEALARLQRSLEKLGNLSPVVFNVRSGKLVSGHQRVKCMAAMGQTETAVWCVDLDEKQETAALLRLNNADGEWDVERLKGIVEELGDVDLDLAGFTNDALADLESKEVTFKKLTILPPPSMAWALIGIPITDFASVQVLLDALPPSAHITVTGNDQQD